MDRLYLHYHSVNVYNILYTIMYQQARTQGWGWGSTPPPPPHWLCNCFCFVVVACHPGGRSGRRTVPLPNNVNDVKIVREKNVSESPPPPPPPPRSATFSDLARHRGIKNPAYASVYQYQFRDPKYSPL